MNNDGMMVFKNENNEFENRHVIITGLGRSGTTAVAKVFQEFGFQFDNPTVVMESKKIRSLLNEKDRGELKNYISSWKKSSDRHALKEPKMFSPDFLEFINSLSPDVAVVIIFRDTIAITVRDNKVMGGDFLRSLEKRSRMYLQVAQTIRNQEFSRDLVLLSYEKLLTDTDNVVRNLADVFGIKEAHKIAQAIFSVEVSPLEYTNACRKKIKTTAQQKFEILRYC
jgi:hypothetical protein